jgi:hypothetical protein
MEYGRFTDESEVDDASGELKKDILNNFFKNLYNVSTKDYPNGTMMLFIPLTEGTHSSTT